MCPLLDATAKEGWCTGEPAKSLSKVSLTTIVSAGSLAIVAKALRFQSRLAPCPRMGKGKSISSLGLHEKVTGRAAEVFLFLLE